MRRYGQHCPISRAAEVLTETWTLLVIRECLRGSETSAHIARGVGRMSRPLLAARLHTLVQTGILSCDEQARGEPRYRVTDAGRELAPVLENLGRWGQRWLPRPSLRDHDHQLLLLDISAEIDRLLLPQDRTVLHINFADSPPPRQWWLILSQDRVEATSRQPDQAVAIRIDCTTSALVDVWLGHCDWLSALRDGDIRFIGDRRAARMVLRWITASRFAHL